MQTFIIVAILEVLAFGRQILSAAPQQLQLPQQPPCRHAHRSLLHLHQGFLAILLQQRSRTACAEYALSDAY